MGTDVILPISPATYGTGISISIDVEREAKASLIFKSYLRVKKLPCP